MGSGGGYHLIDFAFCKCLWILSHILSPFIPWLEHDRCRVYFFEFSYIFFVSSCFDEELPVKREKVVSVVWNFLKVSCLIIILQIYLEKREYFDFHHSLECINFTIWVIRLPGWEYYFTLSICYSCSFYVHALMLVVFCVKTLSFWWHWERLGTK